ncbi:class I SAM-dependent methyltransferase [Pantoea sp. FN060301]|uniref:class I SAM-dependent methyltransferase n=1 Tax=Pantoea sp. FN060301 TaxID=3420380 RepID=UPI003D17BA4A
MDHPSSQTVISLYERHCVAFEKMRPANLLEKRWIDSFAQSVLPGGHILDMGCGNGTPVAQYLFALGFQVTGIDSSSSMIARCREKFPDNAWLVADMRELDLKRKFDGILAWDSFFHLARAGQRQMFDIFSAHASDGAALMFNAGPTDGEAIGEFKGEPLYHSSLAADEYRALMQQSGFRNIKHVVADPLCGGRTIWLAEKRD